jgi:hypothetical protein
MSGSLTSSLTSTNHHRQFQARTGAVTVHTTLTAVRVMAPNALKFNFRGPHTFFFVNFELGFSVTASCIVLKLQLFYCYL